MAEGYVKRGNWSLGQVCRHLRVVQDASIDGYPRWMSFFAPLRPMMRRILLPKLLRGNSPKGIPTSSIFIPPHDVDDESEVAEFAASVARFLEYKGLFHTHPGFGRLDRNALAEIHAAHAAHHLRFLEPK